MTNNVFKFKLDTGEEVEKNWSDEKWPPVKKRPPSKAGKIPFGYMVNPKNDMELIINNQHLYFLILTLDHLSNLTMTLREAADWLFVNSKRELTHAGLRYIWQQHCGDKDSPRKTRNEHLKYGVPKARQKALNYKRGRRIAGIKKTMAAKEKKLRELEEKNRRKQENIGRDIQAIVYDFETIPKEQEVVFRPNEGPQTDFLASTERQVLYGGAAGGGKSYALLADPMRYFGNSNFVGLVLRRTNDELRELKWESQKMYPKAIPGAKWKEKDSLWVFPSGAKLWMSYLDRDEDALRYVGQAFTWIAFDELTQYPTPFAWNLLSSRLRTTDQELKPFLSMRATTNPGGPGHHWVKKMFIDPAPAGKAFWAKDIETGETLVDPDTNKPLFQRKFVPASLSDNPYLAEDGIYKSTLLALPEDQRKKLLYGDWDVMEGAAFPEFNSKTHVVEPFEIPDHWRKFRSCDFGYSSFSSVLWFAIDPSDDQLVVYKELYTSKKTGRELAHMVLDMERGEKISYGILDSSLWHQRGNWGPSIAEEMIAEGCRWKPSDRSKGSRSSGKNRLHELLKTDETFNRPGIIFFNTCRQIISDIPMLPSDPDGVDDIDSRYKSDHSYDALRYGIMSRPRSAPAFGTHQQLYRPSDMRFGY